LPELGSISVIGYHASHSLNIPDQSHLHQQAMPSRSDNFLSRWLHRILWLGVCVCGVYFTRRLLLQERFGFHDWYLFIAHAQDFIHSGQLYDRDLSHYAPSAPIYKFPPLFASLLVGLLNISLNEKTIYLIALAGHLLCYFFSVLLCVKLFRPAHSQCYTPLALILALTFEPFFDNYDSAQMEMYLLLLFSLCLWYHSKGKPLASGICIGIATAIKIYPVYFALHYLASRNTRALAGVLLGLALSLLVSLILTNTTEHAFYFMHILPTLLAESISPRGENLSLSRLLVTLGSPQSLATEICAAFLLLPFAAIFFRRNVQPAAKKSGDDLFWLCLLATTLLFAMKNSWWNYQILLLPPLLLALSLTMQLPGKRWLPLTLIIAACLMIFWCNLGKLDVLILIATRILDTSPLLMKVMLQTGFLRGLATFCVLLALLFLRWRHARLP
jgi:hypothetical protein